MSGYAALLLAQAAPEAPHVVTNELHGLARFLLTLAMAMFLSYIVFIIGAVALSAMVSRVRTRRARRIQARRAAERRAATPTPNQPVAAGAASWETGEAQPGAPS